MDTLQNTQYKRTSRHPSERTRQLISQALSGKPKSETHKQALSTALKNYWGTDENFPDDANGSWGDVMERK